MREMLVAVFQTEANADSAAQALESHGVAPSMIRRYHRDDVTIPHRGAQTATEDDIAVRRHQSSGGFWSWLFGETDESRSYGADYERDYPSYSRAVEAGQTILGVTVEQAEVERVMALLADQMPIELENVGNAELDVADTAHPQVHATTETRLGTRHPQAPNPTEPNRIGTRHTEEVIPLAEERVDVGKRKVNQGTTRVRRYVVEQPVEEQVSLRDEHVEVKRRKPTQRQPDGTAFQERTVEVQNTREEPAVSKTAHVDEEVVVRKEVTERPETIRTTRRKEEADIKRD